MMPSWFADTSSEGRRDKVFYRFLVLYSALAVAVIHFRVDDIMYDAISSAVSLSTDAEHHHHQVILVPPSGELDPVPYERVMSALPSTNTILPFNSSCSMTSQIQITRYDQDGYWLLTTMGQDGQPKSVGGDELYITFYEEGQPRQNPLAIANITDINDGTYKVVFSQSPTAACERYDTQTNDNNATVLGTLEVILEQTCGIGSLPPPIKQDWNVSGSVNVFYVVPNIAAPQHIEPFQAPNRNGQIDLSRYTKVVVLGDSLLGQFVCAENDRPSLEHCATFRPNVWKGNLIQASLHLGTLEQPFLSRARGDLQKVLGMLNTATTTNVQQNNNPRVALVVGSGVWDILADDTSQGGIDFANHLQACRQLIVTLRDEFPNINIYWKSMTAMHIHQVAKDMPNWASIKRSYYMSNSPARKLYILQKELMDKLDIPILDLYPGTFFAAHMSRLSTRVESTDTELVLSSVFLGL